MASEKREVSPEASPLKGPAPKAVPEDTSDVAFEDGIPLNPMAADQSVQFISGTPANGDAKVEIGDGGGAPSFVGLGKEELMKYANDPFWVRLRWILFFLFWVLWFAMLVGAIVIIVLAPRCAEKKAPVDTYYQMKANDLIKEGKMSEQIERLEKLGVGTVVISDVLEHDPSDEWEAVTDFNKVDDLIEPVFFAEALEKFKEKGIKILLQLVPNHSGTRHEWFNNTDSDYYVRRPYDEVKKSVWTTQDQKKNAWTQFTDPGQQNKAYLQQFSGHVADLNFRDEDVISAFKDILNNWRKQNVNGFLISKASFLVENLENLDSSASTRNQPENVDVVARIVGVSSQGPNLVELDGASNETIRQFIDKGLIPVIKSINMTNSDTIRDFLESINDNPKAVISVSKTAGSPEKARLVNLLAGGAGSHILVQDNKEDTAEAQFLKGLLAFQKENPRGKGATVQFDSKDNIVAAHRADGDEIVVIANFGGTTATFDSTASSFNITTPAKGKVVLALNAQQKLGDEFESQLQVGPLSGVIIKLKKEESEAT